MRWISFLPNAGVNSSLEWRGRSEQSEHEADKAGGKWPSRSIYLHMIQDLPVLRHRPRFISTGTVGCSQSLSTCPFLSLGSCNKAKVVGVHHLPQGAWILQQDHHLPPPNSSCPILFWWNNVEPRNIPFFC